MWADWLFRRDKDTFMVDVYTACHEIDYCSDPAAKAMKLLLLREKVRGCNKTWVEGIDDFIDFETQYLVQGQAPLHILEDDDEHRALGVLHASYLHGAFRGLCRTASGAAWIERLGEFCAVAVHQGFKWLRNRGVTEWELPAFGEAWCKGAGMWGLACLCIAVDAAGEDPGNDVALERIHVVVGAHHFAGAHWIHYRDVHPHKWWNEGVRGQAPSEKAIRRFGTSLEWPEEMINVLVRGAKHVNSWTRPSFSPEHFQRTRGFLIWDHTPRLKARLIRVVDEMTEAAGDVSESEAQEIRWRASSWLATHTMHWRGRGDKRDRVLEISSTGSLTGVLRESRPHLTAELVQQMVDWSRPRVGHLSLERQQIILEMVRQSVEVRGRVPGAVAGYASAGTDALRFIDGVWELSMWCSIFGNGDSGQEIPLGLRELTVRMFNSWHRKRRLAEKDFPPGSDVSGGCPVCVGDALFTGLVDNQPFIGVFQCCIWGALLYQTLGLTGPDDMSL